MSSPALRASSAASPSHSSDAAPATRQSRLGGVPGLAALEPGTVGGGVRATLRLEGAALLLGALVAYQQAGAGWGAFALLFLVPDLAMLGYLRGPRTGALLYNAAHSTLGPAALAALGALAAQPVALAIGLVWLAHIGFDRLLGYGLKYGSGFTHTHLGVVGRRDPW